ncbi:MAG: hypothetical protein H7Z38_15095, partial [Rubrivivax sp.]|nr:hypothetical protein [Pyrinomonadaceae bacterium]
MKPGRTRPTPIRFGTDGWRACIADEFTFENVERVAQAYADFLRQPGQNGGGDNPTKVDSSAAPRVVVGYDRRFLSKEFAERACEVLVGNGIGVALFDGDVPTPLVSWAVRERGAAGGVVITASHNPATFNGFKIKAPWGGSATAETTVAVESLVDATAPQLAPLSANASAGLAPQIASYRSQVESFVDLEQIRSKSARVVVDSMHGTGGRWVESFLRGGELLAESIRAERDPLFGGVSPEPIDR